MPTYGVWGKRPTSGFRGGKTSGGMSGRIRPGEYVQVENVKTECWYSDGCDLTGALHVLEFRLASSPRLSSLV